MTASHRSPAAWWPPAQCEGGGTNNVAQPAVDILAARRANYGRPRQVVFYPPRA